MCFILYIPMWHECLFLNFHKNKNKKGMKKVEVKIDALSIAKSPVRGREDEERVGSHLIILTDGNRKLPIVINPNDAQFILIKLNKINITKPFTPEVFKTITSIYNIDVQEVYIYAYEQGSFYTRAVTTDGNEVYEVDCTISTALTMSVVYNCPIFINEEVMDRESIITTEDNNGNLIPIKKETVKRLINSPIVKIEKTDTETLEKLNQQLQVALENEEYELAVELRDKISKLKESRKRKKK